MVAIRSFSSGLESRQLGTPRGPLSGSTREPLAIYMASGYRAAGASNLMGAIQMIHYQPPMNPIEPVRPTRLTWRST